ncbi:MAG: hypothetical protein A2X49_04095 [Lentisphaerae bacterium GWF2_52_8]|nr:MAG: hypothetical protein A2X49_04095 [Lentisphaerae bacterium GWF2_52_8]
MSKSTYQSYAKRHEQDDMSHVEQFYEKMRERVCAVMAHVTHAVEKHNAGSLLDVGCSVGEFLLHAKRLHPSLHLTGLDLSEKLIEEARANPRFEGIEFLCGDLMTMAFEKPFDIITLNNVFQFMNHDELPKAFMKCAEALSSGGTLAACDLFHPFDQDLAIVEKNRWWREERTLYIRSQETATETLRAAGFSEIEFVPFHMPHDIPRRDFSSDWSYTLGSELGRLSMRGIILYPYSILRAVKR